MVHGVGRSDGAGPVVSICITTCNRALFVSEAIDSALAQTYPATEIVIVDDASDDRTHELLKRYSDPRIRLFRNPRRLGQAANRNRAIQLATGDLVKFLDDDDVLDPRCVAELVEPFLIDDRVAFVFCRRRILMPESPPAWARAVAERYMNPHVGFAGLEVVNDGRRLLRQWVASGMRENWIGEPSVVMVKRSVLLESTGFCRHIQHIVDLDLWVRLLVAGRVGFVDEELVSYRSGHAGVTQRNFQTGKTWLDRLWMLENLVREVDAEVYPDVAEALKAERRAVWRTVLKLGRTRDGRRLPIARYRNYLAYRLQGSPRASVAHS